MNKKIIITNYAALAAKYGKAGTTKIRARLANLILGDNKRDLLTSVHDLGTASARYNLPALPPNAPPSQIKRAVDAICKTETPEYLMILGSWDVVPPQKLSNPVFSPPDDSDAVVESDLPYACEKAYDDLIEQFVGPTRVMGRLPDIEGATEPSYLLELLDIAINWQGRDYADYIEYFGLSAKVWKKSTELSVYQTFGSIASLQLAPPGGPNWPAKKIAPRAHFINCHGDKASPEFYGQTGKVYPPALNAKYLAGRVTAGTVVAAECCYGAELYDPTFASGRAGIANTYLREGAYGFMGSSTIAYGPAEKNGQADLVCQYFMLAILNGASLGRAMLEARQRFVAESDALSPHDLKTLAQFSILGDPSIHPVTVTQTAAEPAGKSRGNDSKALAQTERKVRRVRLHDAGIALARGSSRAYTGTKTPTPPEARNFLKKKAASIDLIASEQTTTFRIADDHAGLVKMIRQGRSKRHFHFVYAKRRKPSRDVFVILATARNGMIESYQVLQKR